MELTDFSSIQDYFWGTGDVSTTGESWLNSEKILDHGADSLAGYIRGVVATDVAMGLLFANEMKMLKNLGVADEVDKIMAEEPSTLPIFIQGITGKVCENDPDFLMKFRIQVDTTVMQIVAALPHISEQALLKGVWEAFADNIYLYDPKAEGSFEDYVENVMGWLGEDHSASKKSDLLFWCQSAFPFCKAHGIDIQAIIKNISKARAAVPALREMYKNMEAHQLDPQDMAKNYKDIVKKIGDPSITVKTFNQYLKEQGHQASLYAPYSMHDWATDGNKGSIIVPYSSLQDRIRIMNRLGSIAVESGFMDSSPISALSYADWVAAVIKVVRGFLHQYNLAGIGIEVNRYWDGIENIIILSGEDINVAAANLIHDLCKTLESTGIKYEKIKGAYVAIQWGGHVNPDTD